MVDKAQIIFRDKSCVRVWSLIAQVEENGRGLHQGEIDISSDAVRDIPTAGRKIADDLASFQFREFQQMLEFQIASVGNDAHGAVVGCTATVENDAIIFCVCCLHGTGLTALHESATMRVAPICGMAIESGI